MFSCNFSLLQNMLYDPFNLISLLDSLHNMIFEFHKIS